MAVTYFKIGDTDISPIVSGLKVDTKYNYSSQTNAAGNTVVDLISAKRVLEVTFMPMPGLEGVFIREIITSPFSTEISYLDPRTMELETINAIMPECNMEYYTIRDDLVMAKEKTVTFIEL